MAESSNPETPVGAGEQQTIGTGKQPEGANIDETIVKTVAEQQDGAGDQNESTEQSLFVYAQRIVQIILPVTICACYCSLLIRIISWNFRPSEPNLLDQTWQQLGLKVSKTNQTDSVGISSYLLIAAVFCLLIVLITFLMLFIFYMGWQQYLVYYFYLPPAIVLFILTPAFLRTALQSLNWFALDIYTTIFLTWNFGALGMISIFDFCIQTPLCLQQFYLIHNSAILSVLIILALPGWTPWLLLTFLTLWDLFAVLSPVGPLNLILSMADREGAIEMPGLIYSTDQMRAKEVSARAAGGERDSAVRKTQTKPIGEVDSNESALVEQSSITSDLKTVGSDASDHVMNARKKIKQVKKVETRVENEPISGDISANIESDDANRGVCIGLGDFIVYSLLVGLTSKGRDLTDFHTVLGVLNAIQFGLILTLTILAFRQRPMPALPISVGLGLATTGLTICFGSKLANQLSKAAIFI